MGSSRLASAILAVFVVLGFAVAISLAVRHTWDDDQFSLPVCDDAAVVGSEQSTELRNLLLPLVSSNFFSIFHVAIDRTCPFWSDDDGKCAMRECSVCDCADNEVPAAWRAADAVLQLPNSVPSATDMGFQSSASDLTAGAETRAGTPFRDSDSISKLGAGQAPRPSETSQSITDTAWSSPHQVKTLSAPGCEAGVEGDLLNDVDRSHSESSDPSLLSNWASPSEPDDWTVLDEGKDDMIYVDLRKNPERYTGFSGASTNRIWSAVYDENCFSFSSTCKSGVCAPGTCKEERVLYQLISGVHTSISMHIAHDYLHGTRWGPSLDEFIARVRAFPERVANLQMTLALVLRAVAKAAPSLDPTVYDYTTGDPVVDGATTRGIRKLLAHPVLADGCEQKMFDESDMFVANAEERLPEFRSAFRNISMIMDCVGCEKCRLWGKLQFLGLGTALRLLFSENKEPRLKRNEAIALFNLMYKLLSSTVWIEELNREVEQRARLRAMLGRVIAAVVVLGLTMYIGSSHTADKLSAQLQTEKEGLCAVNTAQDGTVPVETMSGTEPNGGVGKMQLRQRRRASAD